MKTFIRAALICCLPALAWAEEPVDAAAVAHEARLVTAAAAEFERLQQPAPEAPAGGDKVRPASKAELKAMLAEQEALRIRDRYQEERLALIREQQSEDAMQATEPAPDAETLLAQGDD